ncbi:hypothetical protein ACVME8_009731 [Bradyrhizobium diazoefficiens]
METSSAVVGDDELGAVQQRNRNGDALAHAAGELMRIEIDLPLRLRHADEGQRVDRAFAGLRSRESLVRLQGQPDLRAHRQHGIERHQRILEDHRDGLAADRAQLPGR